MSKPDLMIVLGKGKKPEGDEPDGDESIDDQEYEDLGNKVAEAIESKDGLQIGLAIKALVEECMKGK